MADFYFGNRRRATWIRGFSSGVSYSPVNYSQSEQYINGGTGTRDSWSSHMSYSLTWPNTTRDRVREITDYAHGVYGTDLIHWVDPMSSDKNAFNVGWSTPGLAALDGMPLTGGSRPDRIDNADLSLDYPALMAQYITTAQPGPRKFFTLVPPGMVAWVGAHGIASDTGLMVQPLTGGNPSGATQGVPILGVNDPQRVTNSFNGGANRGIEISLDNRTTATVTLAGLILQILPQGVQPKTGGFISGFGHSGCRFVGKPQVTPYQVATGPMPGTESVGLGAELVEVGDWL